MEQFLNALVAVVLWYIMYCNIKALWNRKNIPQNEKYNLIIVDCIAAVFVLVFW